MAAGKMTPLMGANNLPKIRQSVDFDHARNYNQTLMGMDKKKHHIEKANMRSASASVIPDLMVHPDHGTSVFLDKSKMSSISHSRMPTSIHTHDQAPTFKLKKSIQRIETAK